MIIGDVDDPYPRIHELMKTGSVHEVNYPDLFSVGVDPTLAPYKHFTVFGYNAISEILSHPEIFTQEAFRHNLGRSFGRSITTMDPPEHTQYRKIFQKAFLPQNVAKWGEKLVDPVVRKLTDPLIARGYGDLIQEFTIHYPFQVVFGMMALPKEDQVTFHKLATAQSVFPVSVEISVEAGRKLGAYLQDLLALRRAEPGDDIVSALAVAEADGERLPDEVVVSFFRQLLAAGGDTTYRGTSVLLTGLLTNPDQLAAVMADHDLIPQAIEEALRWNSPVAHGFRWVAKDTVLDGVAMPAGSVIDMILGSANRDPERFPDPDKFDIFRPHPAKHIAFASGPHICIGQHLARLEMKRALTSILERMPRLRLDPDMSPPRIKGITLRVPKHLYVRCD